MKSISFNRKVQNFPFSRPQQTKFENLLSNSKLARSFDEKISESFARIDRLENRMPMQAIYGHQAFMNSPSHPHRQKWGEFYNEFFP